MSNGRFYQILAVLTGTINAISDGMLYAWTAPAIPILLSPDSPIKISESDIVWLENIIMIGGIAGIPLTIYSVDKFGRKITILLAAFQSFLAWMIIAFAPSVEVLYVARFIAGTAGDVAFVAGPMYIAEIADHKIRGFLGAMEYIMMLVGAIIVYSVVPYVSLTVSSLVGASFLVLQSFTFPFMPESPYYLLIKGKESEARKSLQWFRNSKEVEEELHEIAVALKRQQSERGRFVDLFLIDSNRKALFIMFILSTSQHFSGFSVILMNIHSILGDAATLMDPNYVAIIFSFTMLVACCAAGAAIDKAGRRILLISSSLLTGVCLLALAIYFAVKNSGYDVTSISWVPMASIMLYAVVYKYGLGMVPIVIGSELFSSSVKALGMTSADFCYIATSILSVIMYQALAHEYGNHVPFFIFALSCFLSSIFTFFYIPETKGKTLDEIQLMLKEETNRASIV